MNRIINKLKTNSVVYIVRCKSLLRNNNGMSTVEYAIGTIAAAAFGAVLYQVVTGDNVIAALTSLIEKALRTNM